MMNPTVIEAAASAYYAEQSRRFGTHDHPPEILFEDPKETERALFTAAIKAADAARTKDGYVLVKRDDLAHIVRFISRFHRSDTPDFEDAELAAFYRLRRASITEGGA